jgi:hypothetical protein
LRQWPLHVTPIVLRSFFGTYHDQQMEQVHGWTAEDAARLCEAVIKSTSTDPTRLTRASLRATGLSDTKLDRLSPHFVHATGHVNAGYLSPLLAERADLMFRPLIAGVNESFIVPAASMAGPSFYEATIAAARAALSPRAVKDLVGKGTERATESLFRFVGIQPTFVGEKYNVGRPDEGECDLVLEDAKFIIFVECKAKPLTRAAMAGASGAAILDYAGGVLKAQFPSASARTPTTDERSHCVCNRQETRS